MSYESPTAAGWPAARLGEDDVDAGWIDWLLTRLDPTPEGYADTSAADLSSGELEALFGWIKGAYDSEIGFVDQHIREVFESLGLEDAVVVFLADHGEEFYEHGALTHGLNLHVETTRVPLPSGCRARPRARASKSRSALSTSCRRSGGS